LFVSHHISHILLLTLGLRSHLPLRVTLDDFLFHQNEQNKMPCQIFFFQW
jgi:hypothetical protein